MGGPSGVPPCPRRPRVESTSGGPAGGGRVRRRAARQDRPPLRPLRRRRAPARLVGGGEPGRQGRARRHLRAAGHGGRPAGRARHQVPNLLHDQAGHRSRGHDAVRGGGVPAQGPRLRVRPVVRRCPRLPRRHGARRHPADRAGDRARARLAPADAHGRADLRVPPRAPGRRDVPGGGARMDLAGCCDAWAGIPLLFQPGSEWNYSVATDVLGRVVEVASGQSLDQFFSERILGPLGMTDTAFWVGEDTAKDLAALYVPEPGSRRALRYDALGQVALRPAKALLGGQGLISTAADYHRFTQMLLGGGELDGTRLLGSRTLRYMTRNHLPGNADLEALGRPLFAETTFDGVGFGLGFSVVLDPVANKVPSSVGEFAWGGAASTAFWVDPAERITVLFLTQLLPSATHPIRPELRQLVYQALVDD